MHPEDKAATLPKLQQRPSVGRIVHYVLEEGPNAGEHRPAIIVKVWADPPESATPGVACQLQVFTDSAGGEVYNDQLPQVMWKTSRSQGDYPGSWHWPEYVPPYEEPAPTE